MLTALILIAAALVTAEQLAHRLGFAREHDGIRQRLCQTWGENGLGR